MDGPVTYAAIEADELIPIELWGRDHWSTLAFIETQMVDRPFKVALDPRMRMCRRTFRVMGGFSHPIAQAMDVGSGSRLSDGTIARGHDDWACIQDFAAEGLLLQSPDQIDLGKRIDLSPRGRELVNLLRDHKARGGSFAEFTAPARSGAAT